MNRVPRFGGLMCLTPRPPRQLCTRTVVLAYVLGFATLLLLQAHYPVA
ncbi:hypothetical protein [Vogesella sp.]